MKILVTILLVQSLILSIDKEENDIYFYDVSMFPQTKPFIVECPEIKIRFNELDESFNPGDYISLRLITPSAADQDLAWYYPLEHDRNISFIKKIHRKIKNISFNPRIKEFTVWKRTIPYPTIRIMSNNILGNARSKVGSKLIFPTSRYEKEMVFKIQIEDKVEYDDILRLQGLYIKSGNKKEAGPTIIEYRKNGHQWKKLGAYEFKVGESFISDVSPVRFIRHSGSKYQLSLDIESGLYPTIEENKRLVVRLSDELLANWSHVDKQTLLIENDNQKNIHNVFPKVSGKDIIFPLTFEIPPKSHLTIPELEIESMSGPDSQLSSGAISIHSKLTGNFDLKSVSNETSLGQDYGPILLMYPKMSIIEKDLLFYTKSDNNPAVSIMINTELGSYFKNGDTIRVLIPDQVDLHWGEMISPINQGGVRLEKIDHKTIALVISKKIEKPLLFEKIPFEIPSNSIPGFSLTGSLSFTPDSIFLPIDGIISFGQPSISMEKPKLLNRLQDNSVLNKIIFVEDDSVVTLKSGDMIEIIGNEEYFRFNTSRLTDIDITGRDGIKRNKKIAVNYQKSTTEKIVLSIREDLKKGERIVIKNIPVSDFQKTGEAIFLKYNINNKCLLNDPNDINIIDLSLELAENQEFIRDINNLNKIFTMEDLSVKIKGKGRLLNHNEVLKLSLLAENTEWGNLNNADIQPRDLFNIEKNSRNTLIITPRNKLYNEENIIIANLKIHSNADEFIDKKLLLSITTDSTVFALSNKSITYSYPSLTSLDDQTFFTDDTSWYLYNFIISTRNLNHTLIPGSRISILLSNDYVTWDTKYDFINVKSDQSDRIGKSVEFERQACHITVVDSIEANMFFEISGLRIKPVNTPDIQFFLKLSIDDGNTICAKDFNSNRFKYIKPMIDYTGKINRSLNESAFAMKSGRNWILTIPESYNYKWDIAENTIEPVFIRPKILKGDLTIDSFSNKIKFSDEKEVTISIKSGYGTISQGLQLSGESVKRLIFKGLKLKPILNDVPSDSNGYIKFSVETPYGIHTIDSDKSGSPDWGIKINGAKSFYYSDLVGKQLEFELSMPQVLRFGDQGVLTNEKLSLYSKEQAVLYKPLVKEFKIDDENQAEKDVLSSSRYIKEFYDDTAPKKGDNWKVWYYLAWAKWHADELGILNRFLNQKEFRYDRVLTKGTFEEDLAKAVKKGYRPHSRHLRYLTIKKGNLLAINNNRIGIAEAKFRKGDFIGAEQDFQKVLNDSKKNDEIRHLSAVANYWLGRIALSLGDIEYSNYNRSFPYKKLDAALQTFKGNQALFSGDYWLEDSIKVYRKQAKKRIKSHRNMKTVSIPRRPRKGGEKTNLMENSYRFIYNSDNDYTYKITGESGSTIGLVNKENVDDFLTSGSTLSPTFKDEIKLTKGGNYQIKFSPKRESIFNLLTYAMLVGLVGILYG